MANSSCTDSYDTSLPLLDAEELLDRIEVSAPYLALRELEVLPNGGITARVDREYDMGLEDGVISMAEAGRHLAIVGSLAAASLQPTATRHFYLAQKARVVGFHQLSSRKGQCRNLRVSARANLNRRAASANTQLTLADGTPLFDMTVDYRVLPERLFRRVAPRAANEPVSTAATDSPVLTYADIERASATTARAQLTVDPADCRGHFPGCPALPVAKLMHALSLLSGAVLIEGPAKPPTAVYAPLIAEMEADNLAWSGQRLELHAELESRTDRIAITRVLATNNQGDRVGYARFTMRPYL